MKTTCFLAVVVFLALVVVPEGFAIINGEVETGHSAVGFVADGAGNMGSAVLIDPYWVLTSAVFASVCTDGFYHVGLDYAAPDELHAISGIYPHMSFDPDIGAHNIALLRLAIPVSGVTPIPYLMSPSALSSGSTVSFVGYGWTSLHDDTNTIRHSCPGTVSEVEAMAFVTLDSNAGPYLGDAGGPALLSIGGAQYVAGLVSFVAAGGLEFTVSTRVSSYVSFIQAVMEAYPPPSGVAEELPANRLLKVTPNPFNPSTEISFVLEGSKICHLTVFDPRGHKVTDLGGGRFDTGRHVVSWHGRSASGRDVPSGVYFVLLQMDGYVETRKVVLAR